LAIFDFNGLIGSKAILVLFLVEILAARKKAKLFFKSKILDVPNWLF